MELLTNFRRKLEIDNFGRKLSKYDQESQINQLVTLLDHNLPQWPLCTNLIKVLVELTTIKETLSATRAKFIEGRAAQFLAQTETVITDTRQIIWEIAGQLVPLKKVKYAPPKEQTGWLPPTTTAKNGAYNPWQALELQDQQICSVIEAVKALKEDLEILLLSSEWSENDLVTVQYPLSFLTQLVQGHILNVSIAESLVAGFEAEALAQKEAV